MYRSYNSFGDIHLPVMFVLVLWATLDHPAIKALSIEQVFPFCVLYWAVTRKHKH